MHLAGADIDECALNPNLCPTLRQCENTPGGYECNCIAGYQENVLTGNCEREWEGVGVRVGDGGSGRVWV